MFFLQSLPEQLQFLFKLVSLVLSFQSPEGYTRDACAAALPLLRETMRRCQPQACTVAAGRHLLRHAAGLNLDFYEVSKCEKYLGMSGASEVRRLNVLIAWYAARKADIRDDD